MNDIAMNQMPGKPLEPDVERSESILSKLLHSNDKVLSPIGTTPVTLAQVLDVLRGLGAEEVRWCSKHGASVVPELGGCGFDLAESCVDVPALVFPTPKEGDQ